MNRRRIVRALQLVVEAKEEIQKAYQEGSDPIPYGGKDMANQYPLTDQYPLAHINIVETALRHRCPVSDDEALQAWQDHLQGWTKVEIINLLMTSARESVKKQWIEDAKETINDE